MARKQTTLQEDKMQEKFQIMHFLDSARWQKSKAKFYPNFAYPKTQNANDLSFDEKLLTHWLLYITDRQMSFRQIWDKGGFVFSEIARTFMANKNIDHLTKFKTNFIAVGNDGYQFQSTIEYEQVSDEQQKRLARYYTNNELKALTNIVFKSRFYTDDYVCMLHTLYALQGYDGSLTNYLAKVLKQVGQMGLTQCDAVKYAVLGMAYALHRLTYEVSFKVNNKRITYKKTDAEKINIVEYVQQYFDGASHARNLQKDIFLNPTEFQKTLDKFFKSGEKFNSMKRVWCALRDYLKDPAYCDDFKAELQRRDVSQALLDALFDAKQNHHNACQWIELPGDVWNENSEFRRCITEDTSGKLGALLRKEYKKLSVQGKGEGYPEEFDTTFDFVPRMCELGNCDICPFAAVKGQGVDVQKIAALCVDDTNKYCPLVLNYCGYYYKCKGRNACDLWSILNKKKEKEE